MNNSKCFVLLTIVLFACHTKPKENAPKEKPPTIVDVMIAQTEKFEKTYEVNGSVLPFEMVTIYPEINGRLVYLLNAEGKRIEKGTILAKVNHADMLAQLNQQKNLLTLAQKTEDRNKKLLEMNGVSQADYDLALSQVQTYQSNIQVLEAQIDKAVMRAPFSGTLGLRAVSPGAYVTPQTALMTLQQIDKLKIDFNVPETYSHLIKLGKTIEIQTNSSEKIIKATIVAIEPSINSTTRNLKVRAFTQSKAILPGSYVKIVLGFQERSILVPTNAIIPDALSSKLVVVKNGKATFVPVETGNRLASEVEILSGIQNGDSVVVSGVLFVRPMSPVKIRKIKTLVELRK
jgi:membrane fusion protein, multidrug efflux system